MHIVVILPRWVGDLVMSTPMLRAVRDHFGTSARITGVAKPMFAELLDGTRWLDRMVFYDRHSRDPERRFRAVVRQLRADPADIAMIVPNSLSSAALAWAGRRNWSVGHAAGSVAAGTTRSISAHCNAAPSAPWNGLGRPPGRLRPNNPTWFVAPARNTQGTAKSIVGPASSESVPK
jgi:ADP-heptose:LPS heptosyltransferase